MIKACVFDAFGTVFNLDLPIEKINRICGLKSEHILQSWRQKQLEYTWLRGLMKNYIPFDQITELALSYAMKVYDISDPKLKEVLLPIYNAPSVFDDVVINFKGLKAMDLKLAILSNGTPSMLKKGVEFAELNTVLDAVLSVDSVKQFKPHPAVYQFAVDQLKLQKYEILFISSNQWDIAGAKSFGFKTAWLNRKNIPYESMGFSSETQITSMDQLVDFLKQKIS